MHISGKGFLFARAGTTSVRLTNFMLKFILRQGPKTCEGTASGCRLANLFRAISFFINEINLVLNNLIKNEFDSGSE